MKLSCPLEDRGQNVGKKRLGLRFDRVEGGRNCTKADSVSPCTLEGRREKLEGSHSESPGLPIVHGLVTCVGVKASSAVPARQPFGNFFHWCPKNKTVCSGTCATVAAAVECNFQGKKQRNN